MTHVPIVVDYRMAHVVEGTYRQGGMTVPGLRSKTTVAFGEYRPANNNADNFNGATAQGFGRLNSVVCWGTSSPNPPALTFSSGPTRVGPMAKARAAKTTAPRVRADKLSVSLGVEDVRWVTLRAKKLRTSVSAVIAGALAEQRRAEARDALLSELGSDDITAADLDAVRREAFGR